MKATLLFPILVLLIVTGCTKTAHRTTTTHFFRASSRGSVINMNDSNSSFSSDSAGFNFNGQCTSGGANMIFYHFPHTLGSFPITDANVFLYCFFRDFPANFDVAHGTLTITSLVPDMVGSFTYTSVDSTIITGSFNQPTP